MTNGVAARPAGEEPAAVRRRLGVPDARVLAASEALLVPRKGHARLLEALARLKRSWAEVPFLVVEGDGESRSALEASALSLKGDVRFVGRERRVQDLMAAADVLVETSVAETPSPNVVVEAMMLGKAELASVRSSADQVVDGVAGLLVDSADEEALARALQRLTGDAGLRSSLGAASRASLAGTYATLCRSLLQP